MAEEEYKWTGWEGRGGNMAGSTVMRSGDKVVLTVNWCLENVTFGW